MPQIPVFSEEDQEYGPQINFKRLRLRMFEESVRQDPFARSIGLSRVSLNKLFLGKGLASLRTRYRAFCGICAYGLEDGTITRDDEYVHWREIALRYAGHPRTLDPSIPETSAAV